MNALAEAPWLSVIGELFRQGGSALYLVGGGVRNPLMNLPISDVDVCGALPPEAVMTLCKGTAVTARLRAAHFGTVELHVADAQGRRYLAEYTTFREDSYRCGHKPDAVRFTTDLAVDALRRDFSVNALYRRVDGGELGSVEDPTGGLRHLSQGVLHTVTPDPDQVLKDDGLRVLRAARFQAELGLTPSDALMDSLARHAPLLNDIARERLRDELHKVLLADLRYPVLARLKPATESGLETLKRIGAWEYIMGGLPYDKEAAQAMKRLPNHFAPLSLRLALLCRAESPATILDRLSALRFAAKEARQAALWVDTLQALEVGSLNAITAVHAGMEALGAAEAMLDALGHQAAAQDARLLRDRLLQSHAPLSLRELAINGNDLLPLCQQLGLNAACIGGMLNQLWERILTGELPNERAALMTAAGQRQV